MVYEFGVPPFFVLKFGVSVYLRLRVLPAQCPKYGRITFAKPKRFKFKIKKRGYLLLIHRPKKDPKFSLKKRLCANPKPLAPPQPLKKKKPLPMGKSGPFWGGGAPVIFLLNASKTSNVLKFLDYYGLSPP